MNELPITAIVVLYYSKHLLPVFLTNIVETIPELNEIILVDNSGEDLSEFVSDTIKVIHSQGNIGYGGAINLGLQHAANDLIVAMNPDIEICLWKGLGQYGLSGYFIASGKPEEWNAMRRFPAMTHDFFRLAFANLTRSFNFVRYFEKKIDLIHGSKTVPVDWVSGSLIITTKKTMQQLGGFDEKYFLFYEDVDLCKRAELQAIPVYILPSVTFKLNRGTSSSIDASQIKLSSEVVSAKRYHYLYSGRSKTALSFTIFKGYCLLIWSVLAGIGYLLNNQKIHCKSRQYKIYYSSC